MLFSVRQFMFELYKQRCNEMRHVFGRLHTQPCDQAVCWYVLQCTNCCLALVVEQIVRYQQIILIKNVVVCCAQHALSTAKRVRWTAPEQR